VLLSSESVDLLARFVQAAVVLLFQLSPNLVERQEGRGSLDVNIRALQGGSAYRGYSELGLGVRVRVRRGQRNAHSLLAVFQGPMKGYRSWFAIGAV
jgi:hypothetical protein